MDNLIVFCIKCGGHFKKEETHGIKVVHDGPAIKGKLYVCTGCYEAIPQTQEVRKMEILK